MVPNLRKQLMWSDQEIAHGSTAFAAKEGVGAVLQRYPIPLLDARVSALWTFDTTFQRGLLSVRQNIHFLDDLVDRSRKYHDMTFTPLEEGNYKLVVENINQAYDLYAERAMYTVNLIRKLER